MCASRAISVMFAGNPNPLILQVKNPSGAGNTAPGQAGDVRNLRGLWAIGQEKSTPARWGLLCPAAFLTNYTPPEPFSTPGEGHCNVMRRGVRKRYD